MITPINLKQATSYFSGLKFAHEIAGTIPRYAIVTPSMSSQAVIDIGPYRWDDKQFQARIPLGEFSDFVAGDRTPMLADKLTDRVAFDIGRKYGVDKLAIPKLLPKPKDGEVSQQQFFMAYGRVIGERGDAQRLYDAFVTLVELGASEDYHEILKSYKPRAAEINDEQVRLSSSESAPGVKFQRGSDLAQQLRELERVKLTQALALVPKMQRGLGIDPVEISIN